MTGIAVLLGMGAPAVADEIDTSTWNGLAGQPATAQSTGFTELTGPGLLHGSEPEGEGVRNYISTQGGQWMAFALRPAAQAISNVQRIWFTMRLRREAGSTFAFGDHFRIHQLPTAALLTTMYVHDDDPASTPNGGTTRAKGWSVHAQQFLRTGEEVAPEEAALVNTSWAVGTPEISWERWTTVEIEVLRGPAGVGRYAVLINGMPVGGYVGLDTSTVTVGQIAASMRIVLPQMPGVRYDLSGPIGFADTEHTYDRGGRVYGAGASVHRLMSVPRLLDAPWSPFTVSGAGAQFSVDAFVSGGLAPNHRRLIMSRNAGETGTIVTQALGDAPPGPSGWSTVVLRTVLVTDGAVATIRLEHPDAETLELTVHDGTLWYGGQAVLAWNPARRYAVLLHMHTIGGTGERAVTLIDMTAEDFSGPVVTSAALPALGSPITALGTLELSGEFAQTGGRVELGGVAVCRRVDMPMVDSYVGAFGNLPAPKLVTLSRQGGVSFGGYDADLVPGRPSSVTESPEGPMYLFPVARSGRKLSDFLATSAAGAAGCRGARWVLPCGWVNDLSFVNSPELAVTRTSAIGATLRGFVQDAVQGGNEVVIGTAIAVPLLSTYASVTLAFQYANVLERRIYADFASSGQVRLADVDAQLSPQAQAALFSPDGVHFSAAGDIVYGQALVGAEATMPVFPCGISDMGVQGGTPGSDGLLDNNDFVVYIDYFFAGNPHADVGRQGGIVGIDGVFDNNDFVVFIDQFFAGCP